MARRHENLFRLVMRDPQRAAAWLRTVLPAGVTGLIDWSALQPASEKFVRDTLRLDEVDLAFRVRCRDGSAIWILIEHKSSAGRVADQVGRYVFELRRHAPYPGAKLPVPVLTVVAFHGDGPLPFTPATAAPLAAAAPTAAALAAALEPDVPIFADDLSHRREEDVLRRGLDPASTLLLLCLGFLRRYRPDEVIAALYRWRGLIEAVDRVADGAFAGRVLRGVKWYCLTCTEAGTAALRDAFENLLHRPDDFIMSTAERIRREGIEIGEARGEARGEMRGETRGETRGRVDALLVLIRRRFGEPESAVVERLAAASRAELDHYLDRILDVASVDELFAAG